MPLAASCVSGPRFAVIGRPARSRPNRAKGCLPEANRCSPTAHDPETAAVLRRPCWHVGCYGE